MSCKSTSFFLIYQILSDVSNFVEGLFYNSPHIFYLSSNEHHVDAMELSAGCLADYGLITGVMKQLLLGLLNDFCHFCICGTFLEIFQLQNITVL